VLRLAIVKYRIDSISEPAPGTKVFRMVPADGAMMKMRRSCSICSWRMRAN